MTVNSCFTPDFSTLDTDVQILKSVNDIDPYLWNEVLKVSNVYLSIPYLRAIEDSLPYFEFRYIIFQDNNEVPIGVAYTQIIKITNKEINAEALNKKMGGRLPKNLINSLDIRVLICGNAFASGENGFKFLDDLPDTLQFDLVAAAIDEINLSEKKDHKKIAISIIKEFWPESFSKTAQFKEAGCSEVNIDVNMVLKLDPSWNSFENYLQAMNSKFRTKAKHIQKQSEPLHIIDFSVDEIERRIDEINELYNSLVDKAKFSFGRLNATTLLNIKKVFGDNLIFKGYYLDNKLIGFSTATCFDDVVDGNYIGLDYDYNRDYAVFQRMLYDFIKEAFDRNATEIRIGRTAEEIKSGVGAEPIEMKFYAKHRNKVTNAILRPFVQNLKPSEFNFRKPFKKEYYNT